MAQPARPHVGNHARTRRNSHRKGTHVEPHSDHVASLGLSVELLRRPRIILVAGEFPSITMATIVWLTEMGLDITLKKVVAYRTEQQVVITVSRLYPLRTVEEFTVAPYNQTVRSPAPDFPHQDWTLEDFKLLRDHANLTTLAALDLCSDRPGEFVPLREVEEKAGRSIYEARGDLAALTGFIKRRLSRSNWPIEAVWAAGGESQIYYRISSANALLWKAAKGGDAANGEELVLDSGNGVKL